MKIVAMSDKDSVIAFKLVGSESNYAWLGNLFFLLEEG
jgi:vacuolar-type H+-ATPase subunit F/Vma7